MSQDTATQCVIKMTKEGPVCTTHNKNMVCPSAMAARGALAMRKKNKKKLRGWARKGGINFARARKDKK